MLELRLSGNDIVAPYAERYPEATFFAGKKPWEQAVDIALPCATQNELNAHDAEMLCANGVKLVAEVSNMGCTAEAVDYFIEHKMPFAPFEGCKLWWCCHFRIGNDAKCHAHFLDSKKK